MHVQCSKTLSFCILDGIPPLKITLRLGHVTIIYTNIKMEAGQSEPETDLLWGKIRLNWTKLTTTIPIPQHASTIKLSYNIAVLSYY